MFLPTVTSCIHNCPLDVCLKRWSIKTKQGRPPFKISKPFSAHFKIFLSFKGKPEALHRSVCFLPNEETQMRWEGNKTRTKEKTSRAGRRCRWRPTADLPLELRSADTFVLWSNIKGDKTAESLRPGQRNRNNTIKEQQADKNNRETLLLSGEYKHVQPVKWSRPQTQN